MAFLYVGAFIVPGPAALATVYGMWVVWRTRTQKILGLWLLSLLFFYLLWFGSGPNAQSYYNLPALAPLCAFFGIGMTSLFEWQKLLRWRRTGMAIAIVLVVLPAIPVWRYLFTPDRQTLEAALWVRANTKPGRYHSLPAQSPMGCYRLPQQSRSRLLFATPHLCVDRKYTGDLSPDGTGTRILRGGNSAFAACRRRIARRAEPVSRERSSPAGTNGLAGKERIPNACNRERLCRLSKTLI